MTISIGSPYRDNPAPAPEEVIEPQSQIKSAIAIALGLLAVQIAVYGRLGVAITAIDALVLAIGGGWMAYSRSGRYLARRQLKIDREVQKLLGEIK